MFDKKEIEEIRLAINKQDDRILELLLERFILSRKIGEIKYKNEIPISNPERLTVKIANINILFIIVGSH